MTEDEALELATHRHYKGGLYRMLGEATHSETGETLVVYEHIWPRDRSLWVRPASLYYGRLADGRLRFEPVSMIVFDKTMPESL
jgi:hypothetical protein